MRRSGLICLARSSRTGLDMSQDRKSGSAGMPRPISYAVFCLKKKIETGARDHWHEEVRLENGHVVVPPHIAAGYAKLREAGVLCLTIGPAYGGYGLPALVNCAYIEMLSRADPSLMTIVGLQAGVAQDIEKYGSDELRRRYLPHFVSGELEGCMDLTEPQAGSDLGGILTRVTDENGRYFVDGGKIFIT